MGDPDPLEAVAPRGPASAVGAGSAPGPGSSFGATIEPFGDAALLISAGTSHDPALAAWARSVAAGVEVVRAGEPAIGRPVAAHASVLVPFDPLALDLERAVTLARTVVASARVEPPPTGRDDDAEGVASAVEIAVRYGGADGPDIDAVAELHGLRPADVVELHAGARYRVLFLGFAPGFGYLGGLPAELAAPRRTSPRERVPAGSVGIAAEHTAVYPLAMPGGWQLIGRTDAVLFDPTRDPPAILRAGATVRFIPAPRR